MTPAVEVKVDQYSLWIFVNQVLHVQIPLDRYRGMTAWCDGPRSHSIEFALEGADPLLIEWGSREIWRDILAKLADVL